ncbi:phage late control D family protein [Paenibacillus provencensis]|uniref:Phage late control D family protein n=1 Tax=Paenibacillus provencensis TaxID=441151 RepID=A0ABW3PS06_9BACL|nr:contractile injection system protein, VgrG/Pvc8 family [Paenibacillus sp. MER 78]MCM3129021.1 contractile injection system protein, VgrG/Pvc8 family [Paenibacillus sp. MER 78]
MSSLVGYGRYAFLSLYFNGKQVDSYLDKDLMSFTFHDGYSGQADDITIQLDDSENKWMKEWVPVIGDEIRAEIVTYHWDKQKEKKKLPCGKFYLKSFVYAGMPNVVTIEASALPVEGNAAKQQKRSKSWEKVQLKTVAKEIADRAKLKLVYEAKSNPTYERLDQSEQTDFEFLIEPAIKEGITLKVSSKSLVMFEESEFEKAAAVFDLTRGKDNILSYQFETNSESVAYGSCEVVYTTPKTSKEPSKTIKGSFTLPNPGYMPTLRIHEQVETVAEANRVARNRLREQNKKAGLANLTIEGDTRIAAGQTINLKGWGYFDGKYIVIDATHQISATAAYTTDIQVRKVLGW